MKFKYSLPCLLLLVVMLTGCGRNFDSSGYVTSIMDTLYKGNYTSYMDFTGVSRSDVSLYRDQWLTSSAEAFMTAFGAGTPSEETTDRIIALLNQLYANASYEVTAETLASDGSPQTVQLSIRPLNILKDNYDAIQVYVHSFNEKNADFSYADLTEEAYYDTYLDGILTILESRLADMTFGEATTLDIPLEKNSDGLYTISEDTLTAIQNTLLPWPETDTRNQKLRKGIQKSLFLCGITFLNPFFKF